MPIWLSSAKMVRRLSIIFAPESDICFPVISAVCDELALSKSICTSLMNLSLKARRPDFNDAVTPPSSATSRFIVVFLSMYRPGIRKLKSSRASFTVNASLYVEPFHLAGLCSRRAGSSRSMTRSLRSFRNLAGPAEPTYEPSRKPDSTRMRLTSSFAWPRTVSWPILCRPVLFSSTMSVMTASPSRLWSSVRSKLDDAWKLIFDCSRLSM